ncbi:MAG: M48 family metallopeptidase [Phycisphaerales bacterium]|nr:M48 family metallopeptidase [Phycisphaerales bacterium]
MPIEMHNALSLSQDVVDREVIHPEDRAALQSLRELPAFDTLVKALMKNFTEETIRGTSLAQKIRLGPNQLSDVYNLLPPICRQLDIKEPELYLEMNPFPNAYTIGDTRTFVTITSGLLESLETEEIQAVLAHECGHIRCRHCLYHTVAVAIKGIAKSALPIPAIAWTPVESALYAWSRASELSADRIAAISVGYAKPVINTMIRLSGGSKAITARINVDEYMKQVKDYTLLRTRDEVSDLLQTFATALRTHPFPAIRVKEIIAWCNNAKFRRFAKAVGSVRCTKCGTVLKSTDLFCSNKKCGLPV